MESVKVTRRRQGSLLLAGLVATAGGAGWSTYDTLFLASLIAAGGLMWSSHRPVAWLMAGTMAAGGLVWASLDPAGCSTGSKMRLAYEKLAGNIPFVGWDEVKRAALSSCFASFEDKPAFAQRIQRLEEKTVAGKSWELYRTDLGKFWMRGPGQDLLTWLIWEVVEKDNYQSGAAKIRPGDTVIRLWGSCWGIHPLRP